MLLIFQPRTHTHTHIRYRLEVRTFLFRLFFFSKFVIWYALKCFRFPLSTVRFCFGYAGKSPFANPQKEQNPWASQHPHPHPHLQPHPHPRCGWSRTRFSRLLHFPLGLLLLSVVAEALLRPNGRNDLAKLTCH